MKGTIRVGATMHAVVAEYSSHSSIMLYETHVVHQEDLMGTQKVSN